MNTESQVLNVPIEDIIPNRFQPRLNFDEEALQELAASIKEHGIIQPLVLRRLGDKYEIIAGERRYKASKMAGLMSVPAIISIMDDKKSAEVAIVENIQRRDLSSIEEAKSYKALLDKGYLTQEELAKKMGISQSAVSNKLRLLTLADEVQNALIEGKISERHARSLLKLNNKEEEVKWLKAIIDERLTVQALDKKLKDIIPKEVEEPKMEDIKPIIEENKVYNDAISTIDINNDISPKPMPNKFFNFLEDETVNMSTVESETLARTSTESTKEELPVEEVELLDFDISPKTSKNMDKADNLINTLITDLNNNSYHPNLVKNDNDKEVVYTITIKKED